ncbi:uncharacterized protein LOC141623224 [Silene latifolia]|uniref:uncharacterized protein LOC141623224 n=1 Tax=Silene latifolia TaxID=37657 RepID=UPI003D76BA4D
MIQELLGGGSANPTSLNPFCSTSPLVTTNTSIATTPPCTTIVIQNSPNNNGIGGANNNTTNNNNNNSNNSNSDTNNNSSGQNLRCPRCDSTNTKFCYYNNYNLTQPRHFCKTCRRYWTKGGTLRNVPIGGGCRKNKSTISSNSSVTSGTIKSSTSNNFLAKAKANFSSDMLVNDNSIFLGTGLLDHSIHSPGSNPLPWSSSLPQTQNSHILALLRDSTPFPNPNPSPSSVFTSLGLDSYGNGASSLVGSFTRNNQHHLNGFGSDFVDNNGTSTNGGSNIMDLYQRLKSSSSNYGYCNENPSSVILGHMVGSGASSPMNSTSFDTTPFGVGGGGDHLGSTYGFMGTSPGISSWSDFPAVPINGAYP